MMSYFPIICFETHVELATQSKLFCACLTQADSPPNSHICPVCTGQPGSLPVLNEQAVQLAILAGKALNCSIRQEILFSRKNYFYPDLPKGFQISQHQEPLCASGYLEIEGDDGAPYRVGIKRIHLEEDAGKLIHTQESNSEEDHSLIDYNRASVPLIEIVMDHERSPLRSISEAKCYLEKLRHLLQYIGVSHALIEKGQFRSDVNVSLKAGEGGNFNPRVELKNMTSVKFVGQALKFEIERQTKVLEAGEELTQETRLYDEGTRTTVVMRKKENAPDYRYFPEPDLPPIRWPDLLENELVEKAVMLPDEEAHKIAQEFSIPLKDARLLTRERKVTDFFHEVVNTVTNKKLLVRWIIQELFAVQYSAEEKTSKTLSATHFAQLVNWIDENKITPAMGRKMLIEMVRSGESPESIVQSKAFIPIRDPKTIRSLIRAVILENPNLQSQLESNDSKAIHFVIGQISKKTKGMADPQIIRSSIVDLYRVSGKDD
jgi:aspartyl-tRNA(Asn)/glutamyl-tRNA(Gln) amidotransferase subunit B